MTVLPLDRVAAIIGDQAFGTLGAPELRMLLVLLAHAGTGGVAWPSLPRLAALTRQDRRDAQRTLQALVAAGLVEVVEEARGRRSRRLRPAPRAAERGLAALLGADDEAGERPAANAVSAGESPAAVGAGDRPAAAPVGAGPIGRRGGSVAHPKGTKVLPPLPPRGASALVPSDPGSADAGAPVSGSSGGATDALASRRACVAVLRAAALRHPNPIAECRGIDQALEDGLAFEQLPTLIALAKVQGTEPARLLVHWLGDVHRWRGVLADAELAERERHGRSAPSARGLSESSPTPVGLCAPALRAIPCE